MDILEPGVGFAGMKILPLLRETTFPCSSGRLSSLVTVFSGSLRNLGSAWVPYRLVDVMRSREFRPLNDIPIWTSLDFFSLDDVSLLSFVLSLCATSDLESSF